MRMKKAPAAQEVPLKGLTYAPRTGFSLRK